MMGLLSVLSLFPIQNLKKRENGQEEDVQERDAEGPERQDNEGKLASHGTSGPTDSER